MRLWARKGLPFCVDCVVKNIPPTPVAQDITGASVGWFGDIFTTEVLTLDASTGRLRFRASSAYMQSLQDRVYATSVYLRINDVTHIFPVVVVVTKTGVVLETPDPGHHQGALGFVDGAVYRLEFSSGELAAGGTGPTGVAGDDGWSPVFAVVVDGTRRVLQVTSWAGGTGTPPASGSYVGPSGLVGTAGAAVDIRGAPGADGVGATPDAFQTVNFGGTALIADSPTDTISMVAGTGIGLSGNAGTDTGTITNTGVTSMTAGLGLSFTGSTGAITATNTGVRTLAPGAGMSVGGTAQDRTVSANVTSVNGSVGAVVTPSAFTTFVFAGVSLLPDVLQDTLTFNAGTGVSFTITVGTDTVAINNTGVTSVNGSTGAVVTPNVFGTVNANGAALVADTTSDTLNVVPGDGILIGGTIGTDTLIVTSLGPKKSYTSVLSANITNTLSASLVLITGQSITVPAGCTVHIDVTLLWSLANPVNGLNYGFNCAASAGTGISYGNYSFENFPKRIGFYSEANEYKSGPIGPLSAGNTVTYFLGQQSSGMLAAGTLNGRCTIKNESDSNLTVSVVFWPIVNGSGVTAQTGSSFEAHIVNV